jgi:hypothetical protein
MRMLFVSFVLAAFAVAEIALKSSARGRKRFPMPGHGKRPWKED